MTRKAPPIDAGNPEALAAWAVGVRSLVGTVKDLLLDATLPGKERVHSRRHIRRFGLRRFHDLEAQLNAIDPPPEPSHSVN